MSTSQSTIDYILDQLSSVPDVLARKMFGEYALYVGKKVVALVCDDTLYVKITDEGKRFLERTAETYKESAPYKGAKPSMQIDGEQIEDREWLCTLIAVTEAGLPEPKKKNKSLR